MDAMRAKPGSKGMRARHLISLSDVGREKRADRTLSNMPRRDRQTRQCPTPAQLFAAKSLHQPAELIVPSTSLHDDGAMKWVQAAQLWPSLGVAW